MEESTSDTGACPDHHRGHVQHVPRGQQHCCSDPGYDGRIERGNRRTGPRRRPAVLAARRTTGTSAVRSSSLLRTAEVAQALVWVIPMASSRGSRGTVSVNERMSMRLGLLSEITAGPSGSLLDNLQEGPDGVPVISPSNLTERRTIDGRHVRRVPWDDTRKLARFALEEGDLLVVRQGSLGRLGLISKAQENWLYSSSLLRVRPRRDVVLPEYLASFLSYAPVQRELLSQALPGTVPSLNSAMLDHLSITVPSVERQRAIIEVLTDIDSQITIQRAIADRLETIKSAIFGEMIEEVSNS